MRKLIATMLFSLALCIGASVSWGGEVSVTLEGVNWEGVTWEGVMDGGGVTWE